MFWLLLVISVYRVAPKNWTTLVRPAAAAVQDKI